MNITGGPLAYKYQFEQMFLHWGEGTGGGGSEHSVSQRSFPAELQLYGYNSQLYPNLTVAQEQPGGVVGVAVMVSIRSGQGETGELARLVARLGQVLSQLFLLRLQCC